MAEPFLFPSAEWCAAAAHEVQDDPAVRAAIAEFGAVVAGIVVQRGDGLERDFCALVRVDPGRPIAIEFPDDEDELEDLEPDYIGWIPYRLARELLESALGGESPDPLKYVFGGQVKVKGDMERIVRHAGRHRGAGLDALRRVPTRFR